VFLLLEADQMPLVNGPVDWTSIDLVVFDVDGTLYDQKRLRARMFLKIAWAVLHSGSLRLPRALIAFRRCREELGGRIENDFLSLQYEMTAARCGIPVEELEELVCEWMERRPLTVIHPCRYPGVGEIFEMLSAGRRTIAVFSDYPAAEKLQALNLRADIVVSSSDSDVGRLKPDPSGLLKILRLAGVEPARSLMIGDRFDRDWAVARSVGMRALIRSDRPHKLIDTFSSYQDDPFPSLQAASVSDAIFRHSSDGRA
jgi:FMN phosphatase YigB (HAD superfamily)